ncbi:MAG: peptidase M50 [Hyphomicrobiales bacterium]|nr:MAG: peptidase M50 [Hyphomicrobiales bacterium]
MAEAFLSPSWYRVAGRRLALKPHVAVHIHRYRGRIWYVLQDGASRRVHRLTPTAMTLLDRLDGRRTLDEVWSEVAGELEDLAPSQEQTIQILTQLHAADLLAGDEAPLIEELVERYDTQRRREQAKRGRNPLSISIPLFDPDRMLAAMARRLPPRSGIFALLLWLVVVLPAAVLAVLHWRELTRTTSDQLLSLQNLALIACIYPVVKALHELGHGLVAKRFGAAVHETGVMLLVFYPVPYVDASGSAAFGSKWRRAAVAAAGIAVELWLAGLALFLWLVIEPGTLRALAYNVMLICGASTLLVNGNPLLRFDGYYVFTDLMEVPNLGQRANRWWGELGERVVFGLRRLRADIATRREKVWFALYAPASYVYRLVLAFSIALFIASEYYVAGVLLAVWSLTQSVGKPLWTIASRIATNPRLTDRAMRVYATLGLGGGALCAALFLVPIPHRTSAQGVVWLPDHAQLRARAPGFVGAALAGLDNSVSRRQPLFQLADADLDGRIRLQKAKLREAMLRAEAERFGDQSKLVLQLREVEDERATLARYEERAGFRTVSAEAAGRFEVARFGDLPGRYVKEGETLGHVLPETTAFLRVVVTQDDIDLVRYRLVGVSVRLASELGRVIPAGIVREIPAAQDELPSPVLSLDGGGPFATEPREGGRLRTLQRIFQFDVEMAEPPRQARFGTRAYIRFEHDWEPLGLQAWRRVRQTFLALFHA